MHQPMRWLYPDATVHTFRGGHAASLARADQYVAAVRAFLDQPSATSPATD
jgi:pimeloyl-ACP methyl ester carboxylesterase